MSRRLSYINLAGVLVLVALCVVQWRHDRQLNLQIRELEATRIALESKLADHEKATKGLTDDLALFKERFSVAQNDWNESRQKLRALEEENGHLSNQRDQLKSSISNWANAVTARDAQLKEANERIQNMADDLTESIQKYNALATNFNALVAELNAHRSRNPQSEKKQND